MRNRTAFIAAVLAALPLASAGAAGFGLTAEPSSVEVPAASAPAADAASLRAQYDELLSALKVYSDAAYTSPQDSPQFMEAAAAGQYLRMRLEAVGAALRSSGEKSYSGSASRGPARVSYRVSSELNDVFGFYGADKAAGEAVRGVPVRQGYCQINYVKNGVPFLVQYDGFLKKGEVIITFDDGPGPLTEEVSEAMKEGNAPSVFFVLGAKLGAPGRERIKKEAADGHFVSVHGYNHATESGKPFTALSTEETLRQLGGVKDSIEGATGKAPRFFRPPYGIISVEALKAIDSDLGLVPVGWTIDTLDWSTKDPEALFQKTVSAIQRRGKGIVLMHDIHPQSRTAAKRLVKWLAENGYKVVSPERMAEAYRGE